MVDPEHAREALRPLLEQTFGRWEASAGTAYAAETWYATLVTALAQEAKSIPEMVALSAFAFEERVTRLTPAAQEALAGPWAPQVLRHCLDTLTPDAVASSQAAAEYLRALRHHWRDVAGLRGQQVMFPLRAALTGTMVGPCLGIVLSLLGWDRCRQRLQDRLP
jgi:hypothetical protein